MKQEKFGDLFELVTGNLHGIAAWHSRLIKEVQELENTGIFQEDKTLQKVIDQWIQTEKFLKKLVQQKDKIELEIRKNNLPWWFKRRTIVPLMKQNRWDSREKTQAIFQQEESHLLNLEKQLLSLKYSALKSEELKEIIQEKLLKKFIKYNQNNEEDCDKIEAVKKAYELLAEYSAVQQKQSANRDGLDYVERLQALKNKLLEVGGVSS